MRTPGTFSRQEQKFLDHARLYASMICDLFGISDQLLRGPTIIDSTLSYVDPESAAVSPVLLLAGPEGADVRSDR